jgi:hypothetical protein
VVVVDPRAGFPFALPASPASAEGLACSDPGPRLVSVM